MCVNRSNTDMIANHLSGTASCIDYPLCGPLCGKDSIEVKMHDGAEEDLHRPRLARICRSCSCHKESGCG